MICSLENTIKLQKPHTVSDSGAGKMSGKIKHMTRKTQSCKNRTIKNFRVVVMGAAKVGKSSIINQLLNNKFTDKYTGTVEEMHRHHFDLGDIELRLEILDTSGSLQFPAMRKLAISTADGFILVHALDDEFSFETVKEIRHQISEETEGIPVVIVGNKSDQQTSSSPDNEDFVATLLKWGDTHKEISAKSHSEVCSVFQELLQKLGIHSDTLTDLPKYGLPVLAKTKSSGNFLKKIMKK